MKYLGCEIKLQNATSFIAKYCKECKGQKPRRTNEIQFTAYNEEEWKENRKMGRWGK